MWLVLNTEHFKKIIKEDYLPQHVFNLNETALVLKKILAGTFVHVSKNEKTSPGPKVSKDLIIYVYGLSLW
jgi:hypothetical protein